MCVPSPIHTQSYDDGEDCKGVWLLCFSSEYELGKFEAALANLWKEQFQVYIFTYIQFAGTGTGSLFNRSFMGSFFDTCLGS